MPYNLIQAHLGFILAATLMCVPNTLCSRSVHVDTKTNLAVSKNSECQKLRDTHGVTDSGFLDCNKVLQKLIKQLLETGEIDPNRCQVDVTEKVHIQIGYCYVSVSIGNKRTIRHLTISDPRLIQSIIEGGYIPEDKTNHALTQREKDSSLTSSSDEDKKKKKAAKKAKKEDKKKLNQREKDSSLTSRSNKDKKKKKAAKQAEKEDKKNLTQREKDSSSSSSSSNEDKKQKKKAEKKAAKKAKEEEKKKLTALKPLKTDARKKAMKDDSSEIQGPSHLYRGQGPYNLNVETTISPYTGRMYWPQ